VIRIAGLAAAAVAALAGWATPAAALVKTHGMMLDSVATMVATDLLRDAPSPGGRPIVVLVPVQGDSMGILAQRLVERLRRDGKDVRLRERSAPPLAPTGSAADSLGAGASGGAPAGAPVGLELNARVDGSSVTYVRGIRAFPFGVKGFERVTSMRASATLLDATNGEVLWARSATASAADVVPKRDVGYASGGSGGVDPPLPRGTGFRLLEPVIVLGVVAGLVVLFYSNRN
jgi:hypothetical protein